MIKTGIYGEFHKDTSIINNIIDVQELKIIGFYSNNFNVNSTLLDNCNIKSFSSISSLINEVDAVIALSPVSDYDNIEFLIKNFKHVFFEPSSGYSKYNMLKLINLINEANVKVQAGFHFRFNNMFLASKPYIKHPKFIQSYNFKQFSPQTNDTNYLLETLVNEINIVLNVIKSNVKTVSVNTNSINMEEPDVLNVRIEFVNRCVVQLTISRIALENKHIINFYCDNNYVSLDFVNNKACQILKRNSCKQINLFQESVEDVLVDPIHVKQNNQYYDELLSFANTILYNKNPEIDFESLIKTYQITEEIKNKIKFP